MTENAVRRGAAGKRPGADDASRRVGGAGERDVAATAGSSDPANDARILIVDDEEAIAGMLDEFFRMEGTAHLGGDVRGPCPRNRRGCR